MQCTQVVEKYDTVLRQLYRLRVLVSLYQPLKTLESKVEFIGGSNREHHLILIVVNPLEPLLIVEDEYRVETPEVDRLAFGDKPDWCVPE